MKNKMRKGSQHRMVEKTRAFVIVPKFGTDLHRDKPLLRKEFPIPMPGDLKLTDKVSSKKMKALRKSKTKDAVNAALKTTMKEVTKLGIDNVNVLIKKTRTSHRIYLADGVTRNTSKRK